MSSRFSRVLSRTIKPKKNERFIDRIGSEQISVNGKPLCQQELNLLLPCFMPPKCFKPGKYWYDEYTGFWGKEGKRPDKIISSGLNVAGELQLDASNGNTRVLINGREIIKIEIMVLKWAKVQCHRDTYFWVDHNGSYTDGAKVIRGNMWGKASTRLICSLLSLPIPP